MSNKNNNRCQITLLINSLCEGGAERAILTISKKFIEEGYKVTILALTKNDFYKIPKGVEIVYLSKMDDSLSGLRKMLYIPYHAWRLKKYIQKNNIDLIQSYLFRANFVNLISTILGSKHTTQVVNRSVISRFFKEGLSGRVNLFLIDYLYPKADMIIHITMEMKRDFNRHFFIPKSEKVIYNSYNIDSILKKADEDIDDFKFKSHKRYIIAVGRLISLKRFTDIIEVVSKLDSDIELIILGEGEERDRLEELAVDLKVSSRIHLLGQVENPFKYIKKSDLFISSSSVEGFPNVLLESMICETMVISSDCLSGPREILAPQSKSSNRLSKGMELSEFGILYAVGDMVALIEAIRRVLIDKTLLYKYQERALSRAKEFSLDAIAPQYIEVLCHE